MRRLPVLVLVGLLLGVVGCDHTTKHWALHELGSTGSMTLIPGLLDLRYTTNTDTAFSLLGEVLSRDARWLLLTTVRGAITLALGVWLLTQWRRVSAYQRTAAVLILGGAIGNELDSLLRGHVIDFIHLHHWPVFNVADIAICAGIGLWLLGARRASRPAEV